MDRMKTKWTKKIDSFITFDHSNIHPKQNQWSQTVILPRQRTSSRQIMHGDIEVLWASFEDIFLVFLRDIFSAFEQILSVLFAFPKWRAVVERINSSSLIGPFTADQSQKVLYTRKSLGRDIFVDITRWLASSWSFRRKFPQGKHGRNWGHASWYRKPE